ncbi:MAG: V-type ATPase 116kDa subunit family protein [Infirmifilum sp.]|uniref:V-type ATPase 116kDa subunit family protein n=1 Tax=Infirmifilum sp. TaxID=2856575 RepID=UPI003D1086A0
MITPEPLNKFRVAVPSEYEVNLLDALTSVGVVHLESTMEARSVLPPMLVDVLEGKISPQTLDVNEALDVARKVLRPDDILLKQIEEKVEYYKQLLKLRKIVDRLYEVGVSPEDIGKEKLGLVTDLIIVTDENLHDAISSFLSIGAIVRRGRISEYEHALLLIYKRDLKEKVEELKKTYSRPLELPSWFYDKPEIVLKRINEEEYEIREELHHLLVEVANVLRDAFEFEKASRLEVIGNAYRALKELRKSKEALADILYTYASLQLAYKECKENGKVLPRLKVAKEYCELVQSVLEEKVFTKERIEKLARLPPFSRDYQSISNSIVLLNKYVGSLSILKEALTKGTSDFCINNKIVVSYGDESLKELCETETLRLYGAAEVQKGSVGWGYGCILSIPETLEETFPEVLRSKYNALVFVTRCDKTDLESLLQELSKKKQAVKNSLIARILKTTLIYFKVDLRKVAEVLGDDEFLNLVELHEKAFEHVQPKPLPTEDRFTFLRNLLTSIDSVVEDIKHAQEEINNILELPSEVILSKLATQKMLLRDILQKIGEYLSYETVLEAMHRAQPLLSEIRVFRTRRITYVEGYIPVRYQESLRRELSSRVPRLLYLKFDEVKRSEKAPSYIENKGLKKYLYRLTSMRGTPSYWEIDPTIIFTGLFTIMYGMMFGDVGQGLLLMIFGLFMLKTKYPLLGISREGAGTLGALATLAGISSMIFGAMYGFMFFLKPLATPILSPIHGVYEIIAVALWFGVLQLLLAMVLNVVNLLHFGDTLGAIFSGMGGMGILFYSSGVAIAYKLALNNFNFSALASPDVTLLLSLVVLSLIVVLSFGIYETITSHHKEKLMHALSEVIEMIIAFPANSLSFIRLAAFAMAHEAFSILAENMALMVGGLASYLVANFLVLGIEALAVGIQALRLTYYEFSTKFFKGEGIEFKPIGYLSQAVSE